MSAVGCHRQRHGGQCCTGTRWLGQLAVELVWARAAFAGADAAAAASLGIAPGVEHLAAMVRPDIRQRGMPHLPAVGGPPAANVVGGVRSGAPGR
jgi:hypothetical protein